jgi:phage FluMu protein Com
MQTVNFNCPHCGNLMAVGANLLGRNVRCPHCKQVVRAPVAPGEAPSQTVAQAPVPTPAPPTPPSRPFNIPEQTEHHESIFGERHDEDVFGSEPLKPTMHAPLPPTIQEIPVPPPMPQRPAYQPPPQTPPQYEPQPMHEPLAFDAPTVSVPAMQALSSPDPYQHRVDDRPPPREREEREPYRGKPRRDEAPGTPAFAWILLVYAGIITIVAGFFGYQYFTGDDKGNHPYKAMPDVLREYNPATKKQVSFQTQPDPKLEIPKDLRVAIGDELTVGDLLVQPLSVERRSVLGVTKYKSAEDKSRPIGNHKTLVLKLRVKNVSSDTTFDPNDPAFVRAAGKDQPPPYTGLQIYQDYFYGTFKWPPDADVEREYIEGPDSEEKPLKPGEERETWIVVAPPGSRASGNLNINRKLEDLAGKPDELVWRVQLRRGIVNFNDGEKEVPASATTVVGVVFRSDQIK